MAKIFRRNIKYSGKIFWNLKFSLNHDIEHKEISTGASFHRNSLEQGSQPLILSKAQRDFPNIFSDAPFMIYKQTHFYFFMCRVYVA